MGNAESEDDEVEILEAFKPKKRKRKRGNSSSERGSKSSSSSSDSSSDTSEEGRRRRKAKKPKKKSSKKSHRKHKKAVSGSGEGRKKEKAPKRQSKEREASAAAGAVGDRWGRYGVVHESDLWRKRPEFSLWLMEVKDKSLEALSQWEERRLFSDFVEDYNTATLPHKKFYNLELWETEERMRQAAAASTSARERTDFNDEAQRMREIRFMREERKRLATAQELCALRQDREKVGEMREQRLMASKVEALYKLGRNSEAEKLAERLKPD